MTNVSGRSGGSGDDPQGVAAGALSYLIWGSFPLLFAALAFVGSVEIVGQRIWWSAVFCLVIVTLSGKLGDLAAILRDRRSLAGAGLCALLLAVNWAAHVTGILSGQVVDAGIGYLVNPLLSVVLGALVLGESMSRTQWVGVVIAGGAISVVGVGYGQLSWVAVILPVSWSLYGLVKKLMHLESGTLAEFTAEMVLLTPIAAAVMTVVAIKGTPAFVTSWPWGSALLILTGVATAVPLLLFNEAARRIRLTTLGILQYISAGMQTILGMTYFAEPMPPSRMAGLGVALVGIAVFVYGQRRHDDGVGATEISSETEFARSNQERKTMTSTHSDLQRGAA